jgi:hypothetical protein
VSRATGRRVDSRDLGRLASEADPEGAAPEEHPGGIRADRDSPHDAHLRGIDFDELRVAPRRRPNAAGRDDHVERRIADTDRAHAVRAKVDAQQ